MIFQLLREDIQRCNVTLLGYCLISNHIHLVLVPLKADGLAKALKNTHGRYASYWNAAHRSTGHLLRGCFYSCALDPTHLWQTLRYTELNPVRAGLVKDAASWPWSSATVHLGQTPAGESLHQTMARPLVCFQLACLPRSRRNPVRAGRNSSLPRHRPPIGTEEFVKRMEKSTRRRLTAQNGGRTATRNKDSRQSEFTFAG